MSDIMALCTMCLISVDIDECARPEESPCPTGSHCINTLGSYVCSCDAGHVTGITNIGQIFYSV